MVGAPPLGGASPATPPPRVARQIRFFLNPLLAGLVFYFADTIFVSLGRVIYRRKGLESTFPVVGAPPLGEASPATPPNGWRDDVIVQKNLKSRGPAGNAPLGVSRHDLIFQKKFEKWAVRRGAFLHYGASTIHIWREGGEAAGVSPRGNVLCNNIDKLCHVVPPPQDASRGGCVGIEVSLEGYI